MEKLKRDLKVFARDKIQQLQFKEAKLVQQLDIQQWDDIGAFFRMMGVMKCAKNVSYYVWLFQEEQWVCKTH